MRIEPIRLKYGTIYFLTGSIGETWAMVPLFVRRVVLFNQNYNENEPIFGQLVNFISVFCGLNNFGINNDEKTLYFGAVYVDDQGITGHAFWSVDDFGDDNNLDEQVGDNVGAKSKSFRVLTIHQVELDKRIVKEERERIRAAFFAMIDLFAESWNVKEIRALALSNTHARYYSRFGFAPHRILMRRRPGVMTGGEDGLNSNNHC